MVIWRAANVFGVATIATFEHCVNTGTKGGTDEQNKLAAMAPPENLDDKTFFRQCVRPVGSHRLHPSRAMWQSRSRTEHVDRHIASGSSLI